MWSSVQNTHLLLMRNRREGRRTRQQNQNSQVTHPISRGKYGLKWRHFCGSSLGMAFYPPSLSTWNLGVWCSEPSDVLGTFSISSTTLCRMECEVSERDTVWEAADSASLYQSHSELKVPLLEISHTLAIARGSLGTWTPSHSNQVPWATMFSTISLPFPPFLKEGQCI